MDLDPLDDDVLMRAFINGDMTAFERLYARHEVALYRFVRRLLGRDLVAQADEVFQDAWLRVIQARDRWQPQGARFRTWLFTIAHHCTIDRLRRSGREVAMLDDDAPTFAPADSPWVAWPVADVLGPAERVFWQRAGERLLRCLEELPLAQKSAFLLHHEDGFSVDELASTLGLGFETAKSRLRYALAKLRTCMGAYLGAKEALESWG